MRFKNKNIPNNQTLDKFLKPKQKDQQNDYLNKAIAKIRVPPSSGLPPLITPKNVVLRYPTKPEIRSYQQEIVASCICYNTLVCLPTGLGKTHIAAIVIANFSRWFPEQKILFLAPTRPLVRQQISALKNLQDQIPKQKIVQLNGQLPAIKRQQLYSSHQVMFATPQTIENDLKANRLDGRKIILIVIDECHRTVGNFAYTQILRYMNTLDVGFRIVGLSATPGSQNEKIQIVINNLNIKKVVYKDQDDPEVKKYLHQKVIHQIEIAESSIIKQALEYLDKFAAPSLGMMMKLQLVQPWILRRGLAGTSFFLIRQKFNQNIKNVPQKNRPYAFAAFKILSFLLKCRKSLTDQGYETFKAQFFTQIQPSRPQRKNKANENQSSFGKEQKLQCSLEDIYSYYPEQNTNTLKLLQNSKSNTLPNNFKKGVRDSKQYKKLFQIFHQGCKSEVSLHPKMIRLAQILTNFFKQKEGKAIIFTQLRISANQIRQYLKNIDCIKSQLFFGQSKTFLKEDQQTGESVFLQLRQKQQIEVIQRYKRGQTNTLISTSIGQEGLDIGEVDCIICYDGGHSPIRAIQRRGRTGRKRSGEVYIMLMEGKQSQDYKKGMKKQSKMKEMLKKSCFKFQYFPYNSSLFEQNSIIPIEHYQNQLPKQEKSSQKNTKTLQQKIDKNEQNKTKKRKRGRPTKSQKSDEQLTQKQIEIDIKITKIGDILSKYKEEEPEETKLESFEQNIAEKGQIINMDSKSGQPQAPNLKDQSISFQMSLNQSIRDDMLNLQHEDEQIGIMKQKALLFDINEAITNSQQSNSQQQNLKREEDFDSQSDEKQIMFKYYNKRRGSCQEQKQFEDRNVSSCNANNSNSRDDSIQSDQILSILQNLHPKSTFLLIDEQQIV